jgi:hypothetical protein
MRAQRGKHMVGKRSAGRRQDGAHEGMGAGLPRGGVGFSLHFP